MQSVRTPLGSLPSIVNARSNQEPAIYHTIVGAGQENALSAPQRLRLRLINLDGIDLEGWYMIGVSAKSPSGFLATRGRDNGFGFAAKRLRRPNVDLSDIVLDGEEDDAVPVFDSCDEVRRKINAYPKRPGVTQAQFCRDLHAQLRGPARPDKPFRSSQLARFRAAKGTRHSARLPLFYAAYVFFEKLRIKEGRPKTKHRRAMEAAWPVTGLPRDSDGSDWFYLP
ncbi:hypothetical protein VTK26DRAFT_86 [Humicola hyalothermophila]